MTKKLEVKFNHCCLCPYNKINLEKPSFEPYWCKRYEKHINEKEAENFPEWCNLEDLEILKLEDGIIIEQEMPDLEDYLIERDIIREKE